MYICNIYIIYIYYIYINIYIYIAQLKNELTLSRQKTT